VDPPGPEEKEIGLPVALVRDGEILSFAGTFYFQEGEAEIGPVATVPEAHGRGYAHSVLAEAARRALERGLAVTLGTTRENMAMRTVAEAVGMRLVAPADQDR
jgi:predicted GNAT family acetyltransferase